MKSLCKKVGEYAVIVFLCFLVFAVFIDFIYFVIKEKLKTVLKSS